MDDRCPVCICNLLTEITTSNLGENRHVDCPRCGSFSFTRTAGRKLASLEAAGNGWKWKLSFWIREQNEKGRPKPDINRNLLVEVIDDIKLPNIQGQCDNLMRWLGKTLSNPSDTISSDLFLLASIVGCEDGRGVDYVASHLNNEGLLNYDSKMELGRSDPYEVMLGLTVKGWNKFNEMTRVKTSTNTKSKSIFISYAREDKDEIKALYEKLREVGFLPWMDTKNIVGGEDWERAIIKSISESTFFLSCLSCNSVRKRGMFQKEQKEALEMWQHKLEDDIYLIPVRLEKCEVPDSLSKFQRIDLFDKNGFEQLLSALEEGLTRLGNEK